MLLTILLFKSVILSYVGGKYYKPPRERYSIIDSFLEKDLEAHEVETEDGYFLTLYHLPGPPGSIPVYLQHGFLGDSITWFLLGKEKSLPYMLLNSGYDVWVGNVRGNTYSKKHAKYSVDDDEFWNFSWDEQGYYDVPAMIKYVTSLKNTSLYYIGHSMGCTTFSVAAIDRPEISNKVKAMIALSPAPYAYHTKSSAFSLILEYRETIMYVAEMFGISEFFSRSLLFNFMSDTVCHVWTSLCVNILFWLDSVDNKNFNITLIPEAANHFPAGTSKKLFAHFIQQLLLNEFRKFDYGPTKNLEIYGSEIPPNYDLSKIRVPIAAFYSNNDNIIVPQDVLRFYEQIPIKIRLIEVEDEFFNHFGYLLASNAPEHVYLKILRLLQDWECSHDV